MRWLIVACTLIGSACLAFKLPLSSSGSIASDLTVKNSEKFVGKNFIPSYLDKAEKYINTVKNDKTLDVKYISTLKRDEKGYNNINDKNEANLTIVKNIDDRFMVLSRRLVHSTGEAYYNDFKATYFDNLKKWIDKDSDPYNILKIDEKNIEQNRDCLYKFLARKFPGNKTAAQIKAMTAQDIMKEIKALKEAAMKKGHVGSSSYLMLLKEIGVFFNDELAKEEYDAFINKGMNRLIITDEKTRNALSTRLNNLGSTLIDAKEKLTDAKNLLKIHLRK